MEAASGLPMDKCRKERAWPGGPPPHIHTREAESFYVLQGEFEFLAEDHWIKAAPGSFVHVPKGSLHTLKNAGDFVGRLLTLVVPAGLDRFFEEAGEPGTDISPRPRDLRTWRSSWRPPSGTGSSTLHLPRTRARSGPGEI